MVYYYPVEDAPSRHHDRENTQDSILLAAGCLYLVFGSLPGTLESDIDVHSSYSKLGFWTSTMRQNSPDDLLEHESSDCGMNKVTVTVWGD